jgi:hypothetical protein
VTFGYDQLKALIEAETAGELLSTIDSSYKAQRMETSKDYRKKLSRDAVSAESTYNRLMELLREHCGIPGETYMKARGPYHSFTASAGMIS